MALGSRETGPSSQPSPRSSKLRPSMAAPRYPEGGRRSRSEVLLQAEVQAAARTELRRTHADAGAVAQLVGAIQRVDQRQLGVQLAEVVEGEVVRHVEVELEVRRQMGAVRHRAVLAEPAAEQVVGADPGAVGQCVTDAARRGVRLIVVEMDV